MGLPSIAKIGEVRTQQIYVSIGEMLTMSGDLGFSVTTAGFTKQALSKVIKKIGLNLGGPAVWGALGISTWALDGMLRILKAKGCKGFKIKYEYTFSFLYGDPIKVPRWKVTNVSYTPVY